MRTWWIPASALTLLLAGLWMAPHRGLRSAGAEPRATAHLKREPSKPPPKLPDPLNATPVGSGDPSAASGAAVLGIEFGGDEAEADLAETIESNQPALPASETEAARPALELGMRGVLPAILRCYEQALSRDPSLAGVLNLQLTLAPKEGSKWAMIEDAVVEENDLKSPLFEQCVLIAVSALRMEKPAGRLYVSYPLHLSPGRDRAGNHAGSGVSAAIGNETEAETSSDPPFDSDD